MFLCSILSFRQYTVDNQKYSEIYNTTSLRFQSGYIPSYFGTLIRTKIVAFQYPRLEVRATFQKSTSKNKTDYRLIAYILVFRDSFIDMSSPRVTSASIEALVFDFLVAATDEILQERRGICNPITHSSASFKDNSDYCKQSLLSWRRDITTPLILDLYIFDPRINKHILMERWKFLYQRANDLKDTSQLLLINHRVGTLLRSLHSFVRLLPGFNLINISQKLPTLSFQLYEQKNTYPTGFVSDISRYNFDPISTSKGLLYMSVKFMTQPFVKVRLYCIEL